MLKSAGAVALGLVSTAYASAPRKRLAVVGVGSRSRMYTTAITGKFRDSNEVVGVSDTNAGRAALAVKTIAVRIDELVTGLTPQDRAPMPSRTASLPMPMRVKMP